MAAWLRWPLALAGACALLALWVQTCDRGRTEDRGPADELEAALEEQNELAWSLRQEVYREARRLHYLRVVDSLIPLLPDDPGVRVHRDLGVEERFLVEVAQPIEEELATIASPRARIGLFLVAGPTFSRYEAAGLSFMGDVVVTEAPGEAPFCALISSIRYRVLREGPQQGSASLATPPEPGDSLVSVELPTRVAVRPEGPRLSILGPCAFWGRHGPPGREVRRWLLEKGGARFAESLEPAGTPDPETGPRSVQELDRSTRSIFGLPHTERWGSQPYPIALTASPGSGCRAGWHQGCAEAFLDPDGVFRAPRGILGPRRGLGPDFRAPPGFESSTWERGRTFPPGPFGEDDISLLGDLERAFGEEPFRRFWTSGEAVPEAFEAAFGVPLTDWVMAWARATYGPEPRGPRVGVGTLLLSLLALAALLGLALVAQARRSVG